MHLQAVVIHSIVDKWDYFFVLNSKNGLYMIYNTTVMGICQYISLYFFPILEYYIYKEVLL